MMRRRVILHRILTAVLPMLAACSFGLTDVPDPSTVVDPGIVESPSGALGLYAEAITKFHRIYGGSYPGINENYSFALVTGLASDEFSTSTHAAFALRRVGPPGGLPTPGAAAGMSEQPYFELHATRLQIDQAIGALKKYSTAGPSSFIAQLYSLRGYISIMFGELYCSGVPFSRAVYGGDLVTGRPLTTEEMFQQAIADFDSSLAITTDSVRIRRLAYVGKARALVNLKEFAQAASLMTEANVPTNYQYVVQFNTNGYPNYAAAGSSGEQFMQPEMHMANRLGNNGLDYLAAGAAGDPRMSSYLSGGFTPVPFPSKFPTGASPVPLADGIEARLIEAEAKLQAKDYTGWANILNTLRQSTGGSVISPLSADSTVNASQTLRENVMFRERAFWLYGTGHRLGDMRRLVRQYLRPVSTVFPRGTHPDLRLPHTIFSDFPNFAPPLDEVNSNPYYDGCFNRDA